MFFRRAAFFGRETERNDSVLVLDIDFFAQKVKHLGNYRKAESGAVTRVRMIRFVESFKQMFKVGRINFRGIADNKLIAILFRISKGSR